MKLYLLLILSLIIFSCKSVVDVQRKTDSKSIYIMDIYKSGDSTIIDVKSIIKDKPLAKLLKQVQKKSQQHPFSLEIKITRTNDTLIFYEDNPLEKYYESFNEDGKIERNKSTIKSAEMVIEIPEGYDRIEISTIDSLLNKTIIKKIRTN